MLLIRNIIKIQQLSKYLDLQQVQIIVGVAHKNINITKLLEIIWWKIIGIVIEFKSHLEQYSSSV